MEILVACLAAYNVGIHHGSWLDLEGVTDADDIQEMIREEVLDSSPMRSAEEWAIHDYDGFGSYEVSEHEDLWNLVALVSMKKKLEEEFEAALVYLQRAGEEPRDFNLSAFEDSYCGTWRTFLEYAEEIFWETNDVPEHLANYIDYEAYARDLMIDHHYVDTSEGLVIFRQG